MTVVVTGGVDYAMTAADFAYLEKVVRLASGDTIVTEPAGLVAHEVKQWAFRRDIPHMRGHPASAGEAPESYVRRNGALTYLADVVVAFPGNAATDDLVRRASDRGLQVYSSPSRDAALRANPQTRPKCRDRASPHEAFGPTEETQIVAAAEVTPAEILHVRGRPVSLRRGRFGHTLHAVERGYFPVSSTGFRSIGRVEFGVAGATEWMTFLEERATEEDKLRKEALQRLAAASKVTEPDGIGQWIQASGAADQALQDGFFAPEAERRSLWAGAYHVYCLIDSDPRYQPQPDKKHVRWTAEHCVRSLAESRQRLALLPALAAGELPTQLPDRLLGGRAYLALPARAGGEPRFDLGGFTVEMVLELGRPRKEARVRTSPISPDAVEVKSELPLTRQMTLF